MESDSPAVDQTAQFFDTVAAARYLSDGAAKQISPRTLETYRVTGAGPRFAKYGRRCLYRRADLDAWVESRLRWSTAGTSATPRLKRRSAGGPR